MQRVRPLAVFLAVLAGWARAPVGAEDAVTLAAFDATLLAQEISRATNEVRREHGVPALQPDARLAALEAMRIHNGHDNPLANLGSPGARVRAAGLPEGTVAENAATMNARHRALGRDYSYRELARVLVAAWMDSPGHRANLLSRELHYLGCGTRLAVLLPGQPVVYAIQDFYTSAPGRVAPLEAPQAELGPGATRLAR